MARKNSYITVTDQFCGAGEIKLGMAFDQNYVILGNSRDQVKQLGNAVTPPAMEWLVGQVIESFK